MEYKTENSEENKFDYISPNVEEMDIKDRIIQNVISGIVIEAIQNNVKTIDEMRKVAPFLDDKALAFIFEFDAESINDVSFEVGCSDEDHFKNSDPDLLVRIIPQKKVFKKVNTI